MKSSRFALGVSALAFVGLLVSGCGGGGTNSTPTPTPTGTPTPVPTPTPTYSTVPQVMAADGDKLFNGLGVKWQVPGSPTGSASYADASTLSFYYIKSDDTYRIVYPTPTPSPTPTTTATPVTISFAAGSGVVAGQTTTFTKTTGAATDTLKLIVPQQASVDLTYTRFLTFDHDDTGTASDWHYRSVYGVLTYAGDKPTTGTATYTTTVYGNATRASTDYLLTGNSTGTFSVDFGKTGGSEITTSLDLKGQAGGAGPVVDFASVTGTGTISGSGFTGTLTGTGTTGAFGGGFFGPSAIEYGYAWNANGTDFTADGFAAGKKNP